MVILGEAYYHRGEFDLAISTLNKAQGLRESKDVEKFLQKIENDKTLEEGYITSKPSPHFVIRSSKEKLNELQKTLIPILERSYRDLTQIFDFFCDIFDVFFNFFFLFIIKVFNLFYTLFQTYLHSLG